MLQLLGYELIGSPNVLGEDHKRAQFTGTLRKKLATHRQVN